MKPKTVSLIPLLGIPFVQPGDDLVNIIVEKLKGSGNRLRSGDILVLAQKVISKAEGAMIDLMSRRPSKKIARLAQFCRKDPRLVELILRESKKVLRKGNGFLIVEHKDGWICANAGIDYSNVPGDSVTLLPEDSDRTARKISRRIKEILGVDIAVIINDSHGRPFRKGSIGICLGSYGIRALVDKRGEKDLFGYRLKSTEIALADEVSSAASLLMGQANEGIPAVIVRGMKYPKSRDGARELIRPEKMDLFR